MTNDFTKIEAVLPSNHKKPILFDMRYKENNKSKPIVIFIHGFKGFKDWGHFNMIADYFAERDFIFCKLNLSHNGTTPDHPYDFVDLEAFGHNNFSIELDDIGVMINYFFSEACQIPETESNKSSIYLLGHSRGGGMALLKAYEDNRIKAVATLSAISDLRQRWTADYLRNWKEQGVQEVYNGRTKQNMPLYYQLIEDFYNNEKRLDIPKAVSKLSKPVLAIHGTADETLPVQMARDMKQWNPNVQLHLIEGAGHTYGGAHPFKDDSLPDDTLEACETICNFFSKVS